VIDMARTARGARSDAPAWIEPMLAKSDGGRLPTGSAITYEYKLWPDFACCPLSA
jgi:bifunctional non-homologous end joining protein LigD